MEKKKYNVFKVIGKILLIILAVIVILVLAVAIMLTGNTKNIQRVDADGFLYSCDYTGDYYSNPLAILPVKLFSGVGCSAFVTHNENDDVITARNYDLPHKDKDGNITGLNVIVNCAPKDGYRSVGIADGAWISMIGMPYYKGALDDGKTPLFPLTFLPYLCMDGINEKGLSVSILALDTKEGEHSVHQSAPGKDTVNISQLLRYMLDKCADVTEAIAMAEKYNMVDTMGYDYHLFVSDAGGQSVVLEWRYDSLTPVFTDAATNFYVGYDDAEDVLKKDGTIKEKFERPADIPERYRYGYGHGYNRFNTVVYALLNAVVDGQPDYTRMSDAEAMATLAACSQAYDGESTTSCTQYSVIYNSTQKTLDVSVMRDYENVYTFPVVK